MPKSDFTSDRSTEGSLLAAGTGVWLLQWCVLIPGLFPILALTAVFALPLLVAGLVPVVLLGVPYLAWRAVRGAMTFTPLRGPSS